MSNNYKVLSKFYERIIYDNNYKKWMEFLAGVVKDNQKGKVGLDVACGSGIFTRHLKRLGYDVTGVDISLEMLTEAKNNSAREKLNIKYLCQDMRSLKSIEKVDFITVINDGLNYVQNKDLLKTFKNFYACLKKGGSLIFDLSTEYKIKNVLSNNAFGNDGDLLSYIWLNSYIKESNAVEISLSIFEKDGDKYIRYNENQIEYAHSESLVKELLTKAGFNVKSVTDGFGKKLNNTSERVLFVCEK
ncbi:MAG: class I SAM-dependent methyltransferase [Clostridia bacterium]|nr:class I SAM-dependent methyltransferase [Clostridia bacterium]